VSTPTLDAVTIGNALVDVIAEVPESFLAEEGLTKASMMLVDSARAAHLYGRLAGAVQASGGSAANTSHGLASLGGRAGFVGKIADDDLGRAFAADLARVGVRFFAGATSVIEPTGRCVIAVTPDGQRTMSTFLGASALLEPADVDRGAVASGAVLFLEGYLFDRDAAKEAFRVAAAHAHAAGRKVALTLSDSFCVERHRADFLALVRDEVDLLFANEHELCALYETGLDAALARLAGECAHAAVTRSAEGSVLLWEGERVTVQAEPVAQVVDVTGAGDMYASGFLYGFTRGWPAESCGRLAGIAAAEVIAHVGPRPRVALSTLIPLDLRP
jgi:sugar/nucleoside kinase (ribokinase family)